MSVASIGELSIKLADAALIAREKGDEVNAIFFAIKAAETLALAKALGWKPKLTDLHMPDDLVVVRNKDADEAGDYRVMKHSEAVGDPQWEITNIDPKDLD